MKLNELIKTNGRVASLENSVNPSKQSERKAGRGGEQGTNKFANFISSTE